MKREEAVTMGAAYSIAEIQRILNPIFTAHGVRRAVLFGSYAKGCAKDSMGVMNRYDL
ncbi:MAG: nucleotidyltransferase domain-containing protein [Oscillibacter sp.]|nr:nucleotidyltransferase domain-containing protein [Oscillibacter sp.]